MAAWTPKLREMIPSLGHQLNQEPTLLDEVTRTTDATLQLA